MNDGKVTVEIKTDGLFARFLVVLVAFVICFIPTWIYLFAHWLLEAHGFWQNLFLLGVGVYFLGAVQIVLFIVFLLVIMAAWLG